MEEALWHCGAVSGWMGSSPGGVVFGALYTLLLNAV